MIKKFLGFIVLVFAMATALVFYSMTNSVSETQGTLTRYVQKAMITVKGVAVPVLKKVGIDVENVHVEDMNIIERQTENATHKVNEATQSLSK